MKFKLILTLFFSALCLNTINSFASAHSNDLTHNYITIGSDEGVMRQPQSTRAVVVGHGPELTRDYITVGSDEGVMRQSTEKEQKFQELFSHMMGGTTTSFNERKAIIKKTVDSWINDGIEFKEIQEFASEALERMKKVAAVYRANGRDDNDGVKAVEYFIEYLKNKITPPGGLELTDIIEKNK